MKDFDPQISKMPFNMSPAKVMVLAVVESFGKKSLIFFIAAGEKANADIYHLFLAQHVAPWLQRSNPDGSQVF